MSFNELSLEKATALVLFCLLLKLEKKKKTN